MLLKGRMWKGNCTGVLVKGTALQGCFLLGSSIFPKQSNLWLIPDNTALIRKRGTETDRENENKMCFSKECLSSSHV